MSVIDQGPVTSGLVARVKGILLTPTAEWDKIDGEAATVKGLYTGYVCVLAAIPVLAMLIGQQIFGGFGLRHPSLVAGVVGAIAGYVMALVSVFILALIIDALAPSFGGQKSQIQAFKVAAYSGTAGWVAGVLDLFPPLSILAALASLYSLYLLYLGLPKLMKAPQEKALGYTAVTIVVAIVLFIVVGTVTGMVAGMATLHGASLVKNERTEELVKVDGATLDLSKIRAASDQMEMVSASAKSIKPVPDDDLKALLPEGVGGYARDVAESSTTKTAGIRSATAKANYARGDNNFTLQVTDLGGASALVGLASTFNVRSSKETANGYERVGEINGRMTAEEYDRAAGTGKYGVLVGGRFMVQANGSASIDDLRSAVNAIDSDRLEALGRADG